MKAIMKWIAKVIIAGICAIGILSLFCVIYSYDGIHISSDTGATDYVWEPSQFKSTMKEGLAWLKMDQNGYNNIKDYSDSPDILLMGSSHMEALQVAEVENVGYLLNELLPDYHTYNIGMSGHTIYRCMDNLPEAIRAYSPQKYVVMVIDSVELSVDDMKSVMNGDAQKLSSYDSGIIYHLQKIPAIKIIYKQLDDWISLEAKSNKNKTMFFAEESQSSIELSAEEEYYKTLSEFLREASQTAETAGVKLIVVYQPMQSLEADGTVSYAHSEESLSVFEKVCEEQGIIFEDVTNAFDRLYNEEHILAHGFSNSQLGEGHLNKYGHKVVAKEIALKIKELEAK